MMSNYHIDSLNTHDVYHIQYNPFDENRTVYQMMEIHGMDLVRGGIFLNKILSKKDRDHITREIAGARDLCFLCGDKNHFASECILRDLEPLPIINLNPSIHRMSPILARSISRQTGESSESIMIAHNNNH